MKKTCSNLPSHPDVLATISYDPLSGLLTWLFRDRRFFKTDGSWKSWNTRFANQPAFTADGTYGYKQGAILGCFMSAQRLIWFYQTGEWPIEVDHEDGDTANNEWLNLRAVTHTINMKNKKKYKTNSSGFVGVYKRKDKEEWEASIRIDGVLKSVGYFDSPLEASIARQLVADANEFHENHGRE